MALSQSTPVQVDASGGAFAQVKINTSKSLLLYDNTTELLARVCDISSGSVSLGTPTEVIGNNDRGEGDIDRLETGKAIVVYNDVSDSSQYKLQVLEVSGSAVSTNTPTDISTYTGNGSRTFVAACTSSLGFAIINSSGDKYARFTVGGVDGTDVTVTDTSVPTGTTWALRRLDNTRVVRFFSDTFGNASWSIIDISSGISEGTDVSDSNRDPTVFNDNRHPMVNVDGDKIVTVYTETTSSPDEIVAVVTDTSTGTTITGLGSFLTVLSNISVAGGAVTMADNDTMLIYYIGASSAGQFETLDISGTTLTSNSDTIGATYNHINTTVELVESGKAVVFFNTHVAIVSGLPSSMPNELRHISIDTDVENFYVTGNEDGTFKLYTYDIETATLQMTETFGAATYADIDNGDNDLRVKTKPTADKVLYLWGKDGNDVITNYNDKNGTLDWVDVGAGTATWGTALVAAGLEIDPLDPTDVLVGFTDGEFYRTEEGTTNWAATGGSVGSDIRNIVRHPVIDSQVFAGGTATGTIHYTHNYAYSFTDTGGTAAGTIHGWAIDR